MKQAGWRQRSCGPGASNVLVPCLSCPTTVTALVLDRERAQGPVHLGLPIGHAQHLSCDAPPSPPQPSQSAQRLLKLLFKISEFAKCPGSRCCPQEQQGLRVCPGPSMQGLCFLASRKPRVTFFFSSRMLSSLVPDGQVRAY